MFALTMQVIEKIDSGYRLPPSPGCPRAMYRMMIKCWYASSVMFLCNYALTIIIHIVFYRHPDPRSRPQFGQITKLLSGNSRYLLGWSDKDKQVGGRDATKLGAPLESTYNLYSDLQQTYQPKKFNN